MTTLKKLASDLRAASQQLESAEQQLHELADGVFHRVGT